MQFTPIHTERLTLRPCTALDIPALVPLIGVREVAATTARIPHPYGEADAHQFLALAAEGLASGTALHLGVFLREAGTLCGGVGLMINREHRRAELGYWIGVPFWGKGYATEAARALVDYGFRHLELHRIFAAHFAGNAASGAVLKKAGMRHEGIERGHILKWGRFLDVEVHGITADDWRDPRR